MRLQTACWADSRKRRYFPLFTGDLLTYLCGNRKVCNDAGLAIRSDSLSAIG